MSIEERSAKYSIELYPDDAYKSSITNGLIAARGYQRGTADRNTVIRFKSIPLVKLKVKKI